MHFLTSSRPTSPPLSPTKRKKPPRAWLLTGPYGCSKTTIARMIMRYVNCRDPGGAEVCKGGCESCRAMDAKPMNHPDIEEIDCAANSSVEDIRALLTRVSYAASLGFFRGKILDEAHQLSKTAQTTLLKVFEEPPSTCILLVCSNEPTKINDALKSRGQQFEVKLLPRVPLAKHLYNVALKETGRKLPQQVCLDIADASGGHARNAISILQSACAYLSEHPVEQAIEGRYGARDRGRP
jgi:DNA polymerase III subunit gamma/tau